MSKIEFEVEKINFPGRIDIATSVHYRKVNMYVFTDSTKRTGYDTRSVFKQNLTCLNSEFFFSETGCHTKVKEPSLHSILPLAGMRIDDTFPRGISKQYRLGFELESPCLFSTSITTTPRRMNMSVPL